MSAPDEPSPVSVEAERGAEAKRWLAIAQDDLEVSLAARNLPQPRAGIAAYHDPAFLIDSDHFNMQ